jgi:hypothetical protein
MCDTRSAPCVLQIRSSALLKVAPRCPGAGDPKDRVQNMAVVSWRSAGGNHKRREERPLSIRHQTASQTTLQNAVLNHASADWESTLSTRPRPLYPPLLKYWTHGCLLAVVAASGIYKGRKPEINVAQVRAMKAQGVGPAAIAKALKIGRVCISCARGWQLPAPVSNHFPRGPYRSHSRRWLRGRDTGKLLSQPSRPTIRVCYP